MYTILSLSANVIIEWQNYVSSHKREAGKGEL